MGNRIWLTEMLTLDISCFGSDQLGFQSSKIFLILFEPPGISPLSYRISYIRPWRTDEGKQTNSILLDTREEMIMGVWKNHHNLC